MRYKPKNIAALQVALGGLPDTMRVELEADIGASPKTVGELRRLAAYETAFKVVREYFAAKGQEATEKYFWKNSKAAYRWGG